MRQSKDNFVFEIIIKVRVKAHDKLFDSNSQMKNKYLLRFTEIYSAVWNIYTILQQKFNLEKQNKIALLKINQC